MSLKLAMVLYWLTLLIILCGIVPVGTFVVPAMVPGWKAQGLKEAPVFWQLLTDLSDFLVHRWYFWLPPYVLLGIWLRSLSRRAAA